MAIFHGNSIPAGGGSSITQSYSVRFDDVNNPHLTYPGNFTPSSPYTVSFWFKRTKLDDLQFLYRINSADNILFNTDNTMGVERRSGSFTTTRRFRDTSNWYHLVLKSTSSDYELYINGELEQTGTGTANPFTAGQFCIGNNYSPSSANAFNGYIAEYHWVDGQSLGPESFGESGTYGEWKPIEYTGGHGTNGFYLPFSNPNTVHDITANGNAQHKTLYNKIGASSICFDGSGDYLTIPASNDWWDVDELTIEMWAYWNNTGSSEYLISNNTSGNPSGGYGWYITKSAAGSMEWSVSDGNGNGPSVTASGLQAGQWYHVAAIWKNAGTEMELFLDGVSQGNITSAPSSIMNVNIPITIGAANQGASHHMNGYVDEVRISNVARYTSNFTPSTTAFESDVNTLLLLHSDTTNGSTTFVDSSGVAGGLGHDSSGNGNHFTLNNINPNDQSKDHPTSNFCQLVPVMGAAGVTYSNSNLTASSDWYHFGHMRKAFCSFSIPLSGKWYWEWIGTNNPHSGFGSYHPYTGGATKPESYLVEFFPTYVTEAGTLVTDTQPITGFTYNTGTDVMGIAVDRDNDTCEWFVNGNSIGSFTMDPASRTVDLFPRLGDGSSSSSSTQYLNFGQDSTFGGLKNAAGNLDANGLGSFQYPVPTDHLALCSANLPEPAVKPVEHFNATLYTGTGGTQSLTGIGFSPDLTVLKRRSGISKSWMWTDTVRGAGKYLQSDSSGSELDDIQTVNSFDADGITLGNASPQQFNDSGAPHVLYSWYAGTSVSGNTSGSGTSKTYTGSVNASAGFSIIKYTGNGTAGHTIPHHLGVAPDMIIIKGLQGTDDWYVYNSSTLMGNTKGLQLSNTGAANTTDQYWNNTSPDSSVFTTSFNSGNNQNDSAHIAYCFRNIEGYSKIGHYKGGYIAEPLQPYIHLGFRPSFLMVKGINRASPWLVIDNARQTQNASPSVSSPILYANDTTTELTSHPAGAARFDFFSNGIKIRHEQGDGDINTGDGEYMFIAFAEQPFKYTNAQ